jgi:hypothetical protein
VLRFGHVVGAKGSTASSHDEQPRARSVLRARPVASRRSRRAWAAHPASAHPFAINDATISSCPLLTISDASRKEAIRCLKRRLSDVIFRQLIIDHDTTETANYHTAL